MKCNKYYKKVELLYSWCYIYNNSIYFWVGFLCLLFWWGLGVDLLMIVFGIKVGLDDL